MKFKNLEKNDIYCIPIGEIFGIEQDEVQILYAPLSGNYSLATPTTLEELDCAIENDNPQKQYVSLLKDFCRRDAFVFDRIPNDTSGLHDIDILVNSKCNFHCIYCYSAKGRSTQELSFETIKTFIDYLFDGHQNSSEPYSIHFSGGGEPLMSFDVIKQTIEYIHIACERGNRHTYKLGVVTNGSLLTTEIAKYLHENNVEIIISFELLERLQNMERGHYSLVASNIDALSDCQIPFGVRTTFTPQSVTCMCEMVETVVHRFPCIRGLTFDVVLAPSLFPTPHDLEKYYSSFLDNYYKAKQLGKSLGVNIFSVAAEPLISLRERYCTGKFVLTPWGKITTCARVSSPKDDYYSRYEFGSISNESVDINDGLFCEIMKQCNIYSIPRCKSCYARWNCGGGCQLFYHQYATDYHRIKCDFTRNALRLQLFNMIKERYYRQTGRAIEEYVRTKIKTE